MSEVDVMERYRAWKIAVCPTCNRFIGGKTGCAGTMAEPHERTRCMWVEVVPASQLEGAVEAARVVIEATEPCAVGNRHVLVEHLDALAKACGLPPVGGR